MRALYARDGKYLKKENFQEAIMKKFSIKSLLVLVLALVLAVSLVLVACDKKDDGGKDNGGGEEVQGYTAGEYFTKLWDLSKSIGNETIAANQNIAVSADLGVELAVKSTANNAVTKKVGIGFAIDAVLDRHNVRTETEIANGTFNNANVSKDTALKIKVYDVTTGENWATVYYFMGDAGNLYIDFAGQNIILPFDYANDQLGSWLSKTIFEDNTMVVYDQVMQNGYVYEKVEGSSTEYKKFYYVPDTKTINGVVYEKGWHEGVDSNYKDVYYKGKAAIGGILTDLSTKMGADWNLNVLVNDVFSLIKRSTQMDLVATVGGLASTLRVPERDIYDAEGNLNIAKILTSGSLGKLLFAKLSAPKTDANGVTTYTAPINTKSTVLSTVLSMASPLLSGTSELALEFKEKDNHIQNFSIKADLKNLATSDKEYPALTVSINKLQFRGVDQNKTSDVVKMETAKQNYSTDVALDYAVALDVDGVTIRPSTITNRNTHFENVPDIVLDGQLVVSLNGKLDLKNKTDNQTNALATVSYKAKGATTAVPFLSASFVGNRLGVTVNQDLKVKAAATTDADAVVEVPLAKTLVNCFGGYVFEGLKGAFGSAAAVFDQFANVFFAKNDDGTLNYFELNENFKGAVWDNINIVPLFQKGVNGIVEMLGGKGLVDPDAKTSAINLTAIANTITKVIPLFTTGADGLTVTVDNINNVISNIGREFDTNMTTDGNVESITKWDNGNWIPDMAKLLVIAGATYTNADKVNAEKVDVNVYRTEERNKYKAGVKEAMVVSDDDIAAERAKDGNAEKTDAELIEAIKEARYNAMTAEQIDNEMIKLVGSHGITAIRFAGKSDDEVVALVKADKAFIRELLASSAVVKVNMSGKTGFSLAINANVANAKVGISFTVGAHKTVANEFEDVAKGVTQDTAGWFYFTF